MSDPSPAPSSTWSFIIASAGLVPVYWVVRLIMDRSVYQAVAGIAIASARRKLKAPPPVTQKQLDKFTESLWKAMVYVFLHACTWCTLWGTSWLFDPDNYWVADAPGGKSQLHIPAVEQLYRIHTGFYMVSVLMLMLWETRRKDFPVMLAHHVVTLCLLIGSYAVRYTRIGSVILLLHDPSDILLELAKLLNYAGKEASSTAAFVSMMLSWAVLRLWVFPAYVVHSAMIGATRVRGTPVDHYWVFNGLLCALVAMHVYWFLLICKVAVTVLGGAAKDVREDDD